MKRIYLILLVGMLIIISTFCIINYSNKNGDVVQIVKDSSFFNKFYIKNEKVYIECKITFKNSSNRNIKFRLLGNFKDDVKLGLLKTEDLIGYDQQISTSEFTIERKSKEYITVIFIGDYGGTEKKHNRNLPYIKVDIIN